MSVFVGGACGRQARFEEAEAVTQGSAAAQQSRQKAQPDGQFVHSARCRSCRRAMAESLTWGGAPAQPG